MDDQQQSRWRPTKRQLLWAGGIVLALAFVVVLYGGYRHGWKWTGLPKRTLWDWLELLIVPAVLALGGYLFTRSENQRTRDIAQQQADTDRGIAEQRRQDDALQAYLDQMGRLLLDKDRPLRFSTEGDEVRTLAQARTLTVLARLDGVRKGSVVGFLSESKLITKDHLVLSLSGADLGGALLIWIDLGGADLRWADLRWSSASHSRGTVPGGCANSSAVRPQALW